MNNTNQYDIIIIGSGPAGYTAANATVRLNRAAASRFLCIIEIPLMVK